MGLMVMGITIAVTIDSYERNKYTTPWFLLSILTGVIGALFYYVTIRTEDDAESLPSPSATVRVLATLLSVVGPVFIMISILAVIGDETGAAIGLFGFPALAVGCYLILELSRPKLKTQRLLAEGVSILIFGSLVPLMVLLVTIGGQNWILLVSPLVCIGLLTKWVQVREIRKADFVDILKQ